MATAVLFGRPAVISVAEGGAHEAQDALALIGEIDCSNSPSLARSLAARTASGHDVRLDVRELEFIDLEGVRAIHAVARRLAERGRRLILVSPGPVMRRTVALMGLGEMFTIEEASSWLTPPTPTERSSIRRSYTAPPTTS
jgi:anti-anti-sigma factor